MDAYRALAQVYDDGRLMISEAVAARFELFLEVISEADEEDPPTRARAALEAARSAYADALALALGEIAPPQDAANAAPGGGRSGGVCRITAP